MEETTNIEEKSRSNQDDRQQRNVCARDGDKPGRHHGKMVHRSQHSLSRNARNREGTGRSRFCMGFRRWKNYPFRHVGGKRKVHLPSVRRVRCKRTRVGLGKRNPWVEGRKPSKGIAHGNVLPVQGSGQARRCLSTVATKDRSTKCTLMAMWDTFRTP